MSIFKKKKKGFDTGDQSLKAFGYGFFMCVLCILGIGIIATIIKQIIDLF